MYEDLMKQLKYCANSDQICKATAVCPFYDQREEETHDYRCVERMMSKAADAVEELVEERDMYIKAMADEHNRAARLAWEHRWIPVTERLPEGNADVFLCYEWTGRSGTIYREVGITSIPEIANDPTEMLRPLYWMPLPEPPKEET